MPKWIVKTNQQTTSFLCGPPRLEDSTEWPECRTCDEAMTHLFTLDLDEIGAGPKNHLLVVFMCCQNPGMCDEWAADAGANRAILQKKNVAQPVPDSKCAHLYNRDCYLAFKEFEEPGDEGALFDFYDNKMRDRSEGAVVGKASGEPIWLQGSGEWPECKCGSRMPFVAQIEGSASEDLDFGDAGTGYIFCCPDCSNAKFLWQCV